MTANAIPPALRDLLAKLEFLSMIERGKKPCMDDMTFVDATSWWGAFKRAFSGQSKKSTVLHINQIIDQTISSIEEYKGTEFLPIVINTLSRSRIGIDNLSTTYQKYPHIVAQLNVCLANIDLQLKKNEKHLHGHKLVEL